MSLTGLGVQGNNQWTVLIRDITSDLVGLSVLCPDRYRANLKRQTDLTVDASH
jgi:hypothetical protein